MRSGILIAAAALLIAGVMLPMPGWARAIVIAVLIAMVILSVANLGLIPLSWR